MVVCLTGEATIRVALRGMLIGCTIPRETLVNVSSGSKVIFRVIGCHCHKHKMPNAVQTRFFHTFSKTICCLDAGEEKNYGLARGPN